MIRSPMFWLYVVAIVMLAVSVKRGVFLGGY